MKIFSPMLLAFLSLALSGVLCAQRSTPRETIPLEKMELHNVKAETVAYRGRDAVRLTQSALTDQDETFAVVRGLSLQDGAIELSLTGDTVPDAPPLARGFVGIAFRVSADSSHFECFYLRPKNGRAEDQLQRNHSAQYVSVPGFPWEKLRSETPGKYEAYVDLVPAEWTRIKIQVKGSTARLYVNGAEQPTLIVNDLKQTPAKGGIALWIGPGTIAHFTDLRVTP